MPASAATQMPCQWHFISFLPASFAFRIHLAAAKVCVHLIHDYAKLHDDTDIHKFYIKKFTFKFGCRLYRPEDRTHRAAANWLRTKCGRAPGVDEQFSNKLRCQCGRTPALEWSEPSTQTRERKKNSLKLKISPEMLTDLSTRWKCVNSERSLPRTNCIRWAVFFAVIAVAVCVNWVG